jgi:hypothetical protein
MFIVYTAREFEKYHSFVGYFTTLFSSADCVAWNDRLTDELVRIYKKSIEHLPSGLKKTTKITVRRAGIPADIRNKHVMYTSIEH